MVGVVRLSTELRDMLDGLFFDKEMFALVNVAAAGRLDHPGGHRWRVRRLRWGAGWPFRKQAYTECLWHLWLACPTGHEGLLRLLLRHGRPAHGSVARIPSQVMLGTHDHLEHTDLELVVACMACRKHPIGEATRRLVAERRPARVVDALCEAAADSPFLAAFCAREGLRPTTPG
ncbi:hypothetical protein GCM10023324_08890 [Streptomyces youssoufiensis]